MSIDPKTDPRLKAIADRFRQRLKDKRVRAGQTQGDAARLAGISQPLWSDYESGVKMPGLYMSLRLAYAVNTPLAVLVREGKGAKHDTQ